MQAHNVKPWSLGEKNSEYRQEVHKRFHERVRLRTGAERDAYRKRVDDLCAQFEICADLPDVMIARPHPLRIDATTCAARSLVLFADWLHAMAEVGCDGVPRKVERVAPRIGATIEKAWFDWDAADERVMRGAVHHYVLIVADPFGVRHATLGADPRGACLRLTLPNGAENGEGDGWAV